MARHEVQVEVAGPWSLATSKAFWEGFAPAALTPQPAGAHLQTVFRVERDWSRAEATVHQLDSVANVVVCGDGDLAAATTQVCRFLSLDIDARGWPAVGERDPVIAQAQAQLPGLRPCGFHSPYEAAAWAVLSQRVRIVQAAAMREDLVRRHGDDGAFPAPQQLRRLDLDLPGRKPEYLHAVAEAALDGRLDGTALRSVDPEEAETRVQEVKGLGPFAAELVVVRGANAPDAVPRHEKRLEAEVAERYGPDHTLADVFGALATLPHLGIGAPSQPARAAHRRDRRKRPRGVKTPRGPAPLSGGWDVRRARVCKTRLARRVDSALTGWMSSTARSCGCRG